ncbi:hypothetical protein XHC_0422 [Xanthomonas hortorum pv. carotae str. M081]|nr:hypothetical protein XHC_0422 [Xanthomonas hortorum pv. carotae str. M081]
MWHRWLASVERNGNGNGNGCQRSASDCRPFASIHLHDGAAVSGIASRQLRT